MKWKKKEKDSKKSGAGASKLRKYIYHEALQFLEKVRVHAETTSNIQREILIQGEGQQDDTVDEAGVDSQNTQQTTKTVPNTVYKPTNVDQKNKKKMDDSELRMLKVVETPQQDGDRHLSFFKEIIPSISKFSEPQIVGFQLGILQLVQKMQQTTLPTQVPHNIVHYQQPLSIQVQQQQLFDQEQQYMPMHKPNTGCNTTTYALHHGYTHQLTSRASESRPTYLQQAVQQARTSPAESDLTQMDNMSPDDSDVVYYRTENDDKWNKIYRMGVCSDVVCCSIKISSVRPIAGPGSHPDRVTAA
ncbi:hypothetical protein J6590_086400 [Homalodisca vitripennis]|nr:hypothetical protein J6590_086400 [Homalodisca vitripennis]